MDKLIKLIVAAAVVYFAVTTGYPWLRGVLDTAGSSSSRSGGSEGESCVATARGASEEVADEVLLFSRPPIDGDAWTRSAMSLSRTIADARQACLCGFESCRKASAALDAVDRMTSLVDEAARGGNPPFNLAARQQEIDDLLDEARDLARHGN